MHIKSQIFIPLRIIYFCEVVVVDHIYNEFSSGVKDITAIRDFIRFQYLKENSELSYILLLGDGSYDMKNRVQNNTDFIPTYQAKNSFHPVNSYVSDDYFVMLDEDDGDFLNDIIDLPIAEYQFQINNKQMTSLKNCTDIIQIIHWVHGEIISLLLLTIVIMNF